MKKIILSMAIVPTNSEATETNIRDMLSKVGSSTVLYSAEVELAEEDDLDLSTTTYTWLYMSPDECEPAVKVAGPGETEGDPMSLDEMDYMQSEGVCTRFTATYPRADRYGVPMYAVDDVYAEGEVGNYGFRVPTENGLDVDVSDNGDDSAAQCWLQIQLPR